MASEQIKTSYCSKEDRLYEQLKYVKYPAKQFVYTVIFFSQQSYCYIHFTGKETEPQSERAKSFLQVHIANKWHHPASNSVFIETSCKTKKMIFMFMKHIQCNNYL